MRTVHVLDYVAGNVRSLQNAIEKVGYSVEWVRSPEDIQRAEVSLFEGKYSFDTYFTCSDLFYPASVISGIA
jgi:imidazoleglycerol phosphate synthase glutamine amidotransferase subunit HisH